MPRKKVELLFFCRRVRPPLSSHGFIASLHSLRHTRTSWATLLRPFCSDALGGLLEQHIIRARRRRLMFQFIRRPPRPQVIPYRSNSRQPQLIVFRLIFLPLPCPVFEARGMRKKLS